MPLDGGTILVKMARLWDRILLHWQARKIVGGKIDGSLFCIDGMVI